MVQFISSKNQVYKIPTEIPVYNVIKMYAGDNIFLVTKDNEVYVLGLNDYGEIGIHTGDKTAYENFTVNPLIKL